MANAIVDALIGKTWDKISENPRLSYSDRISLLEKSMGELVDTASALRTIAEHVETESSPEGIRRRATKAAAHKARTMDVTGIGAVQKGDTAHAARVARLVEVQNLEAEIAGIIKTVQTRRAAAEDASRELAAVGAAPAPELTAKAAEARSVLAAAESNLRAAQDRLHKAQNTPILAAVAAPDVSEISKAGSDAEQAERELREAHDELRKAKTAAERASGAELKKLLEVVGMREIIVNAFTIKAKGAADTLAKLRG